MKLLKNLYFRLPHRLRRRLHGWLRPFVRAATTLAWSIQDLRVPIHRIDHDGLSVEFIGRDSVVPYLSCLLFGEVVRPEPERLIPIWRLPAHLRQAERTTDLVCLMLSSLVCRRRLERMTLRIPNYVTQTLPAPEPGQDAREVLKNPSNKNDLNKIRRGGFDYEITRDARDLESFYRDYHTPFTLSRHGEAAQVLPLSTFRRDADCCDLLRIRKGGQVVSGVVSQRIGDVFHNLYNGVLDADPGLVDEGALAAQYFFSIVEASRRGCRRVSLGRSLPFLTNGILVYKKKWNSVIERDSVLRRQLRLRLCRRNPALSHWLEEHPFIAEVGDRFVSLVFLGEHVVLDDAELRSYLKKLSYPGIATMYVVLASEAWADRAEFIRGVGPTVPNPVCIIDLGRMAEPVGWTEALRERFADRATPRAVSGAPQYCPHPRSAR